MICLARDMPLSLADVIQELIARNLGLYSMPRILHRMWSRLWQRRQPLIRLVGDFSYRGNLQMNRKAYGHFGLCSANRHGWQFCREPLKGMVIGRLEKKENSQETPSTPTG
jgi:hypothetical protein